MIKPRTKSRKKIEAPLKIRPRNLAKLQLKILVKVQTMLQLKIQSMILLKKT